MAYVKPGLWSRSIQVLGGLVLGDAAGAGAGNLAVKRLTAGTFVANTSSVGQSAVETATFTLSGATTGDLVIVSASTVLEAGLTLHPIGVVTATSTVTVQFINETSAAVVQTSGLTNRYWFLDIT